MDQLVSLRLLAVVAVCALAGAAWVWVPAGPRDLQQFASWMAPYRHAWYALPMVVVAFIVLAPVPVLVLIAVTGIAFGPVLGPIYAMAGCLSSGSIGFALGRWMGRRHVERLGGARVAQMSRVLHRNGTLAVFLVRKIPAPFALSNIVVGASRVRYRDFILGTILGMSAIVVALAGFGSQAAMVLRDPSPASITMAALFIGIPLTVAWVLNRALRRRTAE
jgi:phospholipase D1/2